MRREFQLVAVISSLLLLLFSTAAAAQSPQEATNPDLAEAERLSSQVVTLYKENKFAEAIPLAKRALKLREKAVGSKHRKVADAAANLALLYLATQKFDDAQQQLKRAISIYEKESDKDPATLAKALERFGYLLSLKREYARAEDFYLRAISLKQKAFGEQHAETISSLNELADLYLLQKYYAKAVPILQRAAAGTETRFGGASRELGTALQRLACAQYRSNQESAAAQTDLQANHILYADVARKTGAVNLEKDIFECRMTTDFKPDFASAARSANFRSATRIEVAIEVDENGVVTNANMVSGEPIFKKAVEKSALAAKFRPLVVDGQPVKTTGRLVRDYAVLTMTTLVAVPGAGRP